MGNNIKGQAVGSEKATVDDFETLFLVGKGAFGKVWKVKKKDNGKIFAMKVLRKVQVIEQNLIDHTNLEKEIMGVFGNHPFIINLWYAFQTDEKLYFILDYLSGGSLFHHLSTRPTPFTEEMTVFYAAEVILGLQHLHENNIVYRDLKLENILLDAEGHIRLTDFGLSARLEKNKMIHSFSGTALYLAPEILKDHGMGHGKSVDFWSLGVLIHIMLTQEPPFWSDNNRALFQLILRQEIDLRDKGLSEDSVSVIRAFLTRDVSQRLGCGEKGFDDAKAHQFFRSINWKNLFARKFTPPFRPGNFEVVENVVSDEQSLRMATNRKDPILTKHENAFQSFSFVSEKAQLLESSSRSREKEKVIVRVSKPMGPLGAKSQPPGWLPDRDVSNCCACQLPFTTLRRRHHCRMCGKIFCNPCTLKRIPLMEFGFQNPVRVCDACFEIRMHDFDDLDEPGASKEKEKDSKEKEATDTISPRAASPARATATQTPPATATTATPPSTATPATTATPSTIPTTTPNPPTPPSSIPNSTQAQAIPTKVAPPIERAGSPPPVGPHNSKRWDFSLPANRDPRVTLSKRHNTVGESSRLDTAPSTSPPSNSPPPVPPVIPHAVAQDPKKEFMDQSPKDLLD